jgi:hypothetical protein
VTPRCPGATCSAGGAPGSPAWPGGLLAEESITRAASAAERANPSGAEAAALRPQGRRVIFLFMHGGPSQVDTFDYKPLLQRDHGKPLPFAKPRVVSSETGNLLKSPWKFCQHGQSGAWVSELFPTWRAASTTCA